MLTKIVVGNFRMHTNPNFFYMYSREGTIFKINAELVLDTIVDKIYMGSTWEVHEKSASEQVYYGT